MDTNLNNNYIGTYGYCTLCGQYHPVGSYCLSNFGTSWPTTFSQPKPGKVSPPISIDRENGLIEIGDVRIELEDCWVPSVSIDGDKTIIKIKPA